MTNSKTTKRALVSSALAMFMCVAMLIGTTFAWFTDTASTSVNKIQAGNLDIELLDEKGNSLEGKVLNWQKVAGHENEEVLWEPGCNYKLQPITIKNNGNLALKYKIMITGIDGDAELNDVITWDMAVGNSTEPIKTAERHLTAGKSEELTISGTMSTAAGNAYQGLSIDGISITVTATQDTVEYDSTTNEYDKNAEYSTVGKHATAKLITAGGLTINETLSIDSDKTDKNSDVIRVTGGNHTITGGTYTAYGAKSNSCLRVDGGTVTIKGGTFEVKEDNNCIYAAGGDIIIEGGSFKSEKEYKGQYWVLNAKDDSGSVITVKGGRFYKFNPSLANTGKGEIVVADGYKVVQNGDWYYVVPENATSASDATTLMGAITDGGNVVLTADVTLNDIVEIKKDVTIYGVGHTITAGAGKDRAFDVQSNENDISIKMYDVTIMNNNGIAYDRGISFYNNGGKICLDMERCNVTTQHYAINVAMNNTDIEINVKNSSLTGYAAAQTWSANSKLSFENCTLTGVNKWKGSDNNFSTVNVVASATGSTVTLKNCTIKNTTTGTAAQRFFGIETNATVTATGCTYENNGMTVTADDLRANVDEYCYIGTGTYTLTIN